jgi:hypothetical protein
VAHKVSTALDTDTFDVIKSVSELRGHSLSRTVATAVKYWSETEGRAVLDVLADRTSDCVPEACYEGFEIMSASC